MSTVLGELKKLRRQAEKAPEVIVKDITVNEYRAGYRAGYLDALTEAVEIVEEIEDDC